MIYKYLLRIGLPAILLFSACEDPASVGLDLIEDSQFDLIFVDTITANFSTVVFDSVATSATGRLLVGHKEDTTFGTISAKAFFQVGLDSLGSYPDDERAEYERIALTLYYDDYSYYDTTQLQTYHVYPLIEELEYTEDGKLYNISYGDYLSKMYDSTKVLGTLSWYPRPYQHEYIEIPLTDALGMELFTLAKSQNDTIQSESDFLEKYKGLALIPALQNTDIIGFSNRSCISVYYMEGGEEQSLKFSVSDNVYFSQIRQDRSTTLYAPLTHQKNEISAESTDNTIYTQGGVGVGIRVEFPYLKSLLTLGNKVDITDANLLLKLKKGTYLGSTPLPANLTAYQVDGLNRISGEYSTTFNLYLDREFKEESYYLLSVSSFLKTQLDLDENNENALLIMLPDDAIGKSVTRLIANGNIGDNASKLEAFVLKNLSIQD